MSGGTLFTGGHYSLRHRVKFLWKANFSINQAQSRLPIVYTRDARTGDFCHVLAAYGLVSQAEVGWLV